MKHCSPIAAIALLLLGCQSEFDNVWRLNIRTVQWDDASLPVSDVQVILEEQRLTNGVLNAFYTEVDEGVSDVNGKLILATERGNVLSIRLHVMKDGCFDEFVLFNPETLVTGEDGNDVDVAIMPACEVEATVSHVNNPCLDDNMIYRWIPRNPLNNGEDARWDCGKEWKAVAPGSSANESCRIVGDAWLAYQLVWSCGGADSTVLDSAWCPAGGSLVLDLD